MKIFDSVNKYQNAASVGHCSGKESVLKFYFFTWKKRSLKRESIVHLNKKKS